MKSRGIRKHGKYTQPVRSESLESYFKTNMADLLGPRCDPVSFRLSRGTRVVCGKPLQRYPHYPLVQAYFNARSYAVLLLLSLPFPIINLAWLTSWLRTLKYACTAVSWTDIPAINIVTTFEIVPSNRNCTDFSLTLWFSIWEVFSNTALKLAISTIQDESFSRNGD